MSNVYDMVSGCFVDELKPESLQAWALEAVPREQLALQPLERGLPAGHTLPHDLAGQSVEFFLAMHR